MYNKLKIRRSCGFRKTALKLKKGDDTSLSYIYQLMHRQVFFMAFSILKDYQLSEDVMQNTFINVKNNISQYKSNTNGKAWIITIAKNMALRLYQKRKREIGLDYLENSYAVSNQYQDQIENSVVLKKAITILTDEERQVVFLNVINGYKHREIAEILNLPLGTVLWIYSKAMKKLRRELEDMYEQ